jgi:hypothetical protein
MQPMGYPCQNFHKLGRTASSLGVGGFIVWNNHEVGITSGFCPEVGFPLCCRFISEELFRDLLSPNGYISGYLNLLRLLIYKGFYAPPLFHDGLLVFYQVLIAQGS